MIIRFEISQVIQKPAKHLFLFVSDFTTMPFWNYYIQHVTRISVGANGIGTLYEQKRLHDVHSYKVVVHDKPDRITFELQPPGPLQQFGFILIAFGNGTRITYHWQVDLTRYKLLKYIPSGRFKNWILSFARKHILNVIKPATEVNFSKLKMLAEEGEVTLQDGRHVSLKDTGYF